MSIKALSITEAKNRKLSIIDIHEPVLASNEFLIENIAVAQNPIDWKQLDNNFGIASYPWTVGRDVAGKIVKVGSEVTKFKIGDRVIAFTSFTSARAGGYQTHTVADESRAAILPESYSAEAGSTLPVGFVTAAAGLIHALKVSFYPLSELYKTKKDEPLLVWGGSGSVGSYVIQLAKAAGYTVIATAGRSNHEFVKSLGADHVFDHRDPNVIADIRKVAGSKLALAYDAVSEGSSTQNAIDSITAPSGGLVAVLLPPPAQSTDKVKVVQTAAGKSWEHPEIGKEVFAVLQELLNQGKVIPNKVKIIPGGLNGVEEGFELGRNHKVSGEKLVYRIADTKYD